MDIQASITAFDALSQETRLRAYRLLVQAGPDGLPAGEISQQLDTPHNTMSFHLSHLSNAGLVTSRKQGRSVIYSADYRIMHDLIRFLVKDCCGGEHVRVTEDCSTGCTTIELGRLL